MSQLAPDLSVRGRYSDLVELGRSLLPRLAPGWTDYNAHDPGITLMELLAWVAEAQIYSLSRSRRDERAAYAALMGILPNGARPAQGLIWPDHDDPQSPAALLSAAFPIEPTAVITNTNSDQPFYHPPFRILWIPARIRSVTSHLADGTVVNHTGANKRGSPAFRPFGGNTGDVLALNLESTSAWPLFPSGPLDDARLVVGVRVDAPAPGAAADDGSQPIAGAPLEVVLVTETERHPLAIMQDTTDGMMRTGYVALDLSGLDLKTHAIALQIRGPRGFDRLPRLLRIEPNIIPVIQKRQIDEESHEAGAGPGFAFDLETPGLVFDNTDSAVAVAIETDDSENPVAWKPCKDLRDAGPDDQVFELDPVAARITFGNGINGALPPVGADILVSYAATAGAAGNMARNRKWALDAFPGIFGVNPDPVAGGQDASSWLDQRRLARQVSKQVPALITSGDIENAARMLPVLEVGRAWVPVATAADLATGNLRLIAMQARTAPEDPIAIPETTRWLDAVRKALLPRLPLGTRFTVTAPDYVTFSLQATLEAEPGRDPSTVQKAVLDRLQCRLLLVSTDDSRPAREFGQPVSRRDVTAWILSLPDVRRVISLKIVLANGGVADEVLVPPDGLPRFDASQSTVTVQRLAGGAR